MALTRRVRSPQMPDVFPAPTANADTTPAAAPRPQPRDTAAAAAATGAAPTPAPAPAAAAAHPDAPRPAIVPAVPESHRRYRIRLRELFGDDDGLCRVGTEVTVAGWVRTMRKQKNIVFVKLTDGSAHATLQVIGPRGGEAAGALQRLTMRSMPPPQSTRTWRASPRWAPAAARAPRCA